MQDNTPPHHPNRRAALLVTGAAALCSAAASAASSAASTVMFEHTFLKAKPGRRDALARYIELNWFVMDQRGVDAGIFTSFKLLSAIDESKDWDLVMVVGYPQSEGYSEAKTQAAFLAIRRAHVEVRVEDMALKDLGEIVQHHRLRLVAPLA